MVSQFLDAAQNVAGRSPDMSKEGLHKIVRPDPPASGEDFPSGKTTLSYFSEQANSSSTTSSMAAKTSDVEPVGSQTASGPVSSQNSEAQTRPRLARNREEDSSLLKMSTDASLSQEALRQAQADSETVVAPFRDSPSPKYEQKERSVPASPLSRVLGFGSLAARLAVTGAYEAVRRQIVMTASDQEASASSSAGARPRTLLSDRSAEHIAETLCKMRGAALKLGQMLSLQDEGILPEPLTKALERVRQGADVMPRAQLHAQLEAELGAGWRARFRTFGEKPVAAASIGQVHRARTIDGRDVAVKVQYPGVGDSIESDLKNLKRLVTYLNVLPPGLYVDEILDVAREELILECDYKLEAQNQERFKLLVESDPALIPHMSVPGVVSDLSSRQVLTSEWMTGEPVDRVVALDQDTRNRVARLILLLTLRELFDWRFMQTDPNWSNFLYDGSTGKLALLDFGASRSYQKAFVDKYLELVWAAANRDTSKLMIASHQLGFLTGDESTQMLRAHESAGLVVGEPFVNHEPFDFHGSNMTVRISHHGKTFMNHRLTPPPREAYSLHRKLAGAFLLCIKLKAVIPCRDLLEETHKMYTENKLGSSER